MIGQLSGYVIEKQPPSLVLDVQGVGYLLEAPMTTFYRITEEKEKITLYTHLTVREDAHILYGFISREDRKLFRELIKVNGVGPKLALTILSGMDVSTFVDCVARQDKQTLVSLPGLGKKTVERLLIEMKDKVGAWQETVGVIAVPAKSRSVEDAEYALIALGYKPVQASKAITEVYQEGHSPEELIKLALQVMIK